MVFKSPSVPEAINLQDTLHLSSALTDSTGVIVQNIAPTTSYGSSEGSGKSEFVGEKKTLH